MTAVAKLTLRPKSGPGGPLVLPYNPEEITIEGSADYRSSPSNDDAPGMQYTGRSPRTTSVTARLDARALGRPVTAVVQQVFDWLRPTAASRAKGAPTPPILALSWGKLWFDVSLTSATARYTAFAADGTPTRGEMTLALTEVVLPLQRQNPTSGSVVGRRSHQVVAGDSLHSIATATYGDPRHWRDLAEANRLDDPMALRTGTQLLLPDLSELTPAPVARSPW